MHSHTIEGDQLSGKISVTFNLDKTFRDFCAKNFNNFDSDQHEPIAIRIYQGMETVVTLYALDKFRQEGTNYNQERVPVKKFKSVQLSLTHLLPFISEYNFTLTAGNYDLDEMEVINK